MISSTRRLALCYGTRPQIVKASVLLGALSADWGVKTFDTGQHYDWTLNGLHYQQLGVRPPDTYLEVGSADHSRQTADILVRVAKALDEYRPEVVVVIGDTNSTLGCALAGAQKRMPVVHVEAGLRANDLLMPEEINRRVVDEISVLLCAPSRRAERYLRNRVSVAQHVAFTGDVARDVLERALKRPELPDAPWQQHGLEPPFVLATLHRAELTGHPDWLRAVVKGFGGLSLPVFFPAHPRTVKALSAAGIRDLPPNVRLSDPVGYLEMVAWAKRSEAIVTDSGGLQREAYWLGTPCVTVRAATEWQETLAEGANILVRPQEAGDLADILSEHPGLARAWQRDAFGTGDAGEAVRQSLQEVFG